MSKKMNETDLLNLIRTNRIVIGEFRIELGSSGLMDLDLKNVIFKDCTILGGDFCSSTFNHCTFDNVLFKDLAVVGVNFDNCDFIQCKFSNIQSDFGMRDCRVGMFIITKEAF